MGNYMSSGNQITTQTQKDFDPAKYSGTWYEIARYPLIWEKDCATAQANYTWDAVNQKILVENICVNADLSPKRSRYGEARVVDPNDKSKLMLKFTDGLPAGPESSYWVFSTDYINYSLVGDDSRNFLWFLTRKPKINTQDKPKIKEFVSKFGFDPEKLIFAESRMI